MKKLLIVVLLLVVAAGGLAYWRGWFSVSSEGVQVDAESFKKDKAAFTSTVTEQAQALKAKVDGLKTTSVGLTDAEKDELGQLEKKHARIEQQIKELDGVGQERFATIKEDLSKSLREVETKIDELTKKLDRGKDTAK